MNETSSQEQTIDWTMVEEQFMHLRLQDQMHLLERLMRKMRESAYLDIAPDDADRMFDEMARDPDIQRELRMQAPSTDNAAVAKESA
jgi:uncharacterized coiled-coil protein SlyX